MKLPSGRGRFVAVDTEGSGIHCDDGARLSVVSLAWEDKGRLKAVALPFDQGTFGKPEHRPQLFDNGDDVNLGEKEWRRLLEWLSLQNLVMHNAKHDLHQLAAGTRFWSGEDLSSQLVWDTMLAEWVLSPLLAAGLEETGQRYAHLGKADETLKVWLKRTHNRYDLVPWDVMEPYARIDAELTLRVAKAQWERVEGEDLHWLPFIEREVALCKTLFHMERRGIGYDIERSREESAKAQRMVKRLRKQLPFTPTPNGAKQWFFEVNDGQPHCVTPKRREASILECCVRTLIKAGIPAAREFAEYQKVTHAISKYYDGFADRANPEDGRLRTDFSQAGTISMRFSSKRVNLQALPHDYRLEVLEGVAPPRSLFRPSPGMFLYELDLSQAELRVASKYARCGLMLDYINGGADPHGETAERLFGSREFRHRQVSKRCNFALIYNVGVDTFVKDVEKNTGVILSQSDGEEVVHGWRALYPEFGRANRRAEMKARNDGYITLINGRQRHFRAHEEYHKAFNQAVQGGIAEFMKTWMLMTDALLPDVLLLQIHDSLVIETALEMDAKTIAKMGADEATDLFKVPMKVDVKEWV